MKTKHISVADLADQFEQFMVPYKTWDLGLGESGITARGIIDLKSFSIYLEQYDPIKDNVTVQKFEKGKYPERWTVDEDGSLETKLTVPK